MGSAIRASRSWLEWLSSPPGCSTGFRSFRKSCKGKFGHPRGFALKGQVRSGLKLESRGSRSDANLLRANPTFSGLRAGPDDLARQGAPKRFGTPVARPEHRRPTGSRNSSRLRETYGHTAWPLRVEF